MEMSITVGFDLLSFSFPTCVMIMAFPILDRLSIRSPPFTVAISFIFSSIVLVFICVISFIVALFRLTGKISLSVEESGNPVIGGFAYGADGFSKVFSGWNNGVVEPIR